MNSFIYNLFGSLMIIWYSAIRWTWFADQSKYAWAYAPINLVTAFSSILFLFFSMIFSMMRPPWLIVLSIFLACRNFYYTIEDIIDLPHNVYQQLIFILIDIIMLIYCLMFIFHDKLKL